KLRQFLAVVLRVRCDATRFKTRSVGNVNIPHTAFIECPRNRRTDRRGRQVLGRRKPQDLLDSKRTACLRLSVRRERPRQHKSRKYAGSAQPLSDLRLDFHRGSLLLVDLNIEIAPVFSPTAATECDESSRLQTLIVATDIIGSGRRRRPKT